MTFSVQSPDYDLSQARSDPCGPGSGRAAALCSLCSLHRLLLLLPTSGTETSPSALQPPPIPTITQNYYPKISWFPGLVLTAAWFIFARVSHRGPIRRSTIPRRMQSV